MQLQTEELVQPLHDTADTEGQMINLKNPATTTMTKKPDEVEVCLPPGLLRAIFIGTPPKITKFWMDSPVKNKLPIGLVIDKLILEDGTTYVGITIKEFLKILASNAESSYSNVEQTQHTLASR